MPRIGLRRLISFHARLTDTRIPDGGGVMWVYGAPGEFGSAVDGAVSVAKT